MDTSFDDESEELSLIRKKLQRRAATSIACQQDEEDRSSTSSEEMEEANDHSTISSPSKHNSSNSPVLVLKEKTNIIINDREFQRKKVVTSWSNEDDDDDDFDAKLAAMNVLPLLSTSHQGENMDNTYPREINNIQKRTSHTPTKSKVPTTVWLHNNDAPSQTSKALLKQDFYKNSPDQADYSNDDDARTPSLEIPHNLSTNRFIDMNINDDFEIVDEIDEDVFIENNMRDFTKHAKESSESSGKSVSYVRSNAQKNPTSGSQTERNLPHSCGKEDRQARSTWERSQNHVLSNDSIGDPFGFDDDSIDVTRQDQHKDISRGTLLDFPYNVTNHSSEGSNKQGSTILDDTFGFDTENEAYQATIQLAEKPHSESNQESQNADDRISEVDPSLYTPQPKGMIQKPIVHSFTQRNRPIQCRKTIPIAQIFQPPISLLWRNKFDTFNQVQSEIANTLAYSDDNIVISAPTGAGKTAVFEMTIARFFAVDLQATLPGQTEKPLISKRRKIVYVSPSKALCEERYTDWSKRLSEMNLGIEIAVVTGDGDPIDAYDDVASSHFILTTPEKWDSISRRWTEKFYLFASVKLFLVDEVHLIADVSRGCCLETIICRMKTIQRAAAQVEVTQHEINRSSYTNTTPDAINSLLRFVAVSATLPNIADISILFESNEAYLFDESYRPVPLTIHVIGQGKIGTEAQNGQFMFWKNLDRNVPELIIRFSNRRPTIVFCHSKADCEKLADFLATTPNIGQRDNETSKMASQTRISKLQRVLLQGLAYHHAGLEIDDRRLIEALFRKGKIRVLCATSTIAMGVNLPAHLVIIKGTSAYRGAGEGGGYQDVDQASLLQMIGRAGRPGFDSTGTAVIMTDNDSKEKFERLASSGLSPARSQLKGLKLVEAINAEVSQRVIRNVENAMNWIKDTLYYIQLVQDPEYHGLKVVSEYSLDTYLLQICRNAIERLSSISVLVSTDSHDIYPLVGSHIMSQRLMSFEAMARIASIPFNSSHFQMIKLLSLMEDLHFPVRRSEKKSLNSAYKKLKLYKFDGPQSKIRIQEPWQKTFVLLQAYVEEIEFDCKDFVMCQEMNMIAEYAMRMLSAIEEFSIKGTKNGSLAVQSMKIRRSLVLHLWSAKDGMLRQIQGIGKTIAYSLHMNGISSFEDVMHRSDSQLECAANRPSPFGKELRKACSSILQCRLKLSVEVDDGSSKDSTTSFTCVLKEASEKPSDAEVNQGKQQVVTYTLIAYTEGEAGIIIVKQNISGPEILKGFVPSNYEMLTIQLIASIVGFDDLVEIKGTMGKQSSRHQTSMATSGKKGQSSNQIGYPDGLNDDIKYRPNKSQSNVDRGRINVHEFSVTNKSGKRQSNERNKSYHTNGNFFDGKLSVTPSPNVTPTTNSQQMASHVATTHLEKRRKALTSSSQQTKKRRSHVSPLEEIGIAGKNLTPDCGEFDQISQHQKLVKASMSPIPQTLNKGDHAIQNEHIFLEVQRPTSIRSNFDQGLKGQLNRSYTTPIQSNSGWSKSSATWNRLKNQQQKSQHRAFVHHADNPFKGYKHDPNETESYLDHLSSNRCERTSIIPSEGLYAIEAGAQVKRIPIKDPGIYYHTLKQRGNFQGRKHHDTNSVSIPELLHQKAAESNYHGRANMDFIPCQGSSTHYYPTNMFERGQSYNQPVLYGMNSQVNFNGAKNSLFYNDSENYVELPPYSYYCPYQETMNPCDVTLYGASNEYDKPKFSAYSNIPESEIHSNIHSDNYRRTSHLSDVNSRSRGFQTQFHRDHYMKDRLF